MIIFKSPEEIDRMRTAGRIVALTIDALLAALPAAALAALAFLR